MDSYSAKIHTHHPDCGFWYDNYPQECTCGLTSETNKLRRQHPVTKEWWHQWSIWINKKQTVINAVYEEKEAKYILNQTAKK